MNEQHLKNFLRATLRRAWLRWPPRQEAKKKAWIKRGVYRCAGYGCNAHEVKAKEVQVDHIKPIGELKNLDTWAKRLFCPASNLQVLCTSCHKLKTKEEK